MRGENGQNIVYLEGTGGSGKSTIAPRVAEALAERGLKVCHVTLPAYHTPTGVILKESLAGRYGYIPKGGLGLLFTLNRLEIAPYLEAGLDSDWSFVIERSHVSNALSIPESTGVGVSALINLRNQYPKQYEEILNEEFANLRKQDRRFLSLEEGVSTTKIFLDTGVYAAIKSREERRAEGETKHDIWEKGEEQRLRQEILVKMIKWEGNWEVVERTGTPSDTFNLVWEKVLANVPFFGQENSEAKVKRPVMDFNYLTQEYFPEISIEGIRRSLMTIADSETGLRTSQLTRKLDGVLQPRLQFLPPEKERR